MKLVKFFFLALYYCVARFAPPTYRFGRIGKWSRAFRYLCARHIFKRCGKHVNVEHMAFFGNGFNIEIGDNSGIGVKCVVPNDIIIGADVMMGPNCFVFGGDTHAFDRTDIPMIQQGRKDYPTRTKIGDDVWIGRQVIILGGKEIGSHTVIGAGTVVSKSVPDYVVAAGNPVRIIRNRI